MRTSHAVTIAAIAVLVVLIGSFIVSVNNDESGDGSFVILHSNDTHCYLGDDGNLGFATLKSLKVEKQSESNAVFVFDAGDFLQGNVYGTLTEGIAPVMVMNQVGYDLGVPGNHEFDFTLPVLKERTSQLNYPIICSNLVDNSTGESVFEEYKILKKGGVTLGCFGLLTDQTATTTKKGNMGDAVVTDPIEAAERMVSFLETKGVDYIVCIGHLGVDKNRGITSDQVCNRVPGIDIFIDGHSHTEMEDGKVCDGSIELLPSDTIIASTGCYCKAFGVVSVDKEGDISAKLYRGEKREDAKIDSIVAGIHKEIDEKLGVKIGSTTITLDGVKDNVRTHETNLGDLIADSMRSATGTDIAIVNGGGIRTSINEGDITLKDVYSVMPFQNDLCTLTVTGDNIYTAMEYSYSKYDAPFGGFLQISGMTVTYDASKAAGSRIVSITVNGEEMDRSASYTLTTSDFITNGGDGHVAFMNIPTQNIGFDTAVLGDYIKELGTIDESTIQGGRLISV